MGQANYANGFEVYITRTYVGTAVTWKKPQLIFVNSMSDLFHKDVPLEYIQRVFDVMHRAYWHNFQVLTKRSQRLLELSDEIEWPDNVWMGVSVENRKIHLRIDHLRQRLMQK